MAAQCARAECALMVAGLPVALIMLAPAAAETQPPGRAAASAAATPDKCPPPPPGSDAIVICTERPKGYRLNPDVMEARREVHSGGRPTSPYPTPRPDCASVGPAPCITAGINLIGAALTAAEMAKRAAEGKEIGSMFKTDPHPTEYQLYLMAKARREQREAEEAAAAKAKAAQAAQKQDAREQTPPPSEQ
jgi:hypothetical protein